MTKESSYYGGTGTEIVSGAPTTAQWNTLVAAFETLQDKVTALETAVGGESSGLVKAVADLQTAVGDADSGAVKAITDLQTVVGNSDAGLVKRVSDLELAAQTAGGGEE